MMLTAFKKHQVIHTLLDVSQQTSEQATQLKELTSGYLSVPTLQFPHGEILIEPPVNQCIQHIQNKYPHLIKMAPTFWQTLFRKKG
jgi:hypothetical protein